VSLESPVVATYGSSDRAAPLVVLLHGRGSDEEEILGLARGLPPGPSYAAVRAPIREGGGFAWFANRGIGRPVAASLRSTMEWFRQWLDAQAPAGRPVVVIGFSGGAAFAGGLVLDDPTRYAAAGLLHGTLPFDVGVPVTPARLAGLPVFLAHSPDDVVIPRDLLSRTWDYLTGESGAPAYALQEAGGHGISASTVAHLGGWLAQRLTFVATHTRPAGFDRTWVDLPAGVLPGRRGDRPSVSTNTPQEQLTQQATGPLQERLYTRVLDLPGVQPRPSAISVPGARAFALAVSDGPPEAFIVPQVGEFAHLHPEYDGSLHLTLPLPLAAELIGKGWGVAHPLAGLRVAPGMVMVFGPRNDEELEMVSAIVATSHAWARGTAD